MLRRKFDWFGCNGGMEDGCVTYIYDGWSIVCVCAELEVLCFFCMIVGSGAYQLEMQVRRYI